MDLLLLFTAAAHLFYTPFTKVEESFNIQAMHDILYLKHNFSQYDHHEFPGVVPRTFLGPLTISILSSPAVILFQHLGIQKFWSQYVVRLVLTAVVCAAWTDLKKAVEKKYGFMVSLWYTLITISQFHFMFYMSRPLPNVMALPLVLYAVAFWLNRQTSLFIWLSGAAIIIFRAELAILLGLLLVHDFYMKKIDVQKFLKVAVPAGIVLVSATVIVDSFFWGRPLWPEGQVLWYNTILNKSSNWGTSPFLWYFYSAIPRAMGVTLFFVPIGLYVESRTRSLGVASITFVFLYSFLPHKELRFIIYVFPLLNLSAACACHRLWVNKTKSVWQGFLGVAAGSHLVINTLFTLFLLVVSGTNYPGGVALSRLHRLAANQANVSVHISNLAAQSGVSRFMQVRSDWTYSKKENINYVDDELNQFTHLLVEAKSKFTTEWPLLTQNFETLEYVDCFSNVGLQYNSFMPVKIKTKPCIGIMKRKANVPRTVVDCPSDLSNEDDMKEETVRFVNITKETLPEEETPKNEHFPYASLDNSDYENSEESTYGSSEATSKYKTKERIKQTISKTDSEENYFKDIDQNVKMFNNEDESVKKVEKIHTTVKSLDLKESLSKETLSSAAESVPLMRYDETIEDDSSGVTVSIDESEEYGDAVSSKQFKSKEINFHELHNIALGKVTKRAKDKLREIIEQHYKSKGSIIESAESDVSKKQIKHHEHEKRSSTKTSIKNIIKQEKIKEMVERISKMNLIEICELDKMTTKECLKKVIDDIDENVKI